MVEGFFESEPRTPGEKRMRAALRRGAALLDLIQTERRPFDDGVNERSLAVSPERAHILFAKTAVGSLLIPAESPVTRTSIRGLFTADEFASPVAKELPDRAFLRTTVVNAEPGEAVRNWTREIAIVFRYDHPALMGRVTAEVEIGILYSGNLRAMKAYRMPTILVNDEPKAYQEADIFPAPPRDVNQFIDYIRTVTQEQPPFSIHDEFAGIDLSGFSADFGDTIE